jgi:hypothetical protein
MDYDFTLMSASALLMHKDDVEEADRLKEWRSDSANASRSVPGDDRSPPWTWQCYLHHDGVHLAMPHEAIMATLRFAGARIKLKGNTTFKALTQSGLLITTEHCHFTNDGHQIAMEDIIKLRDKPFSEHVKAVRKLGFDLLVKRVPVEQKKHVRVRPKFSDWTVSGTIRVLDVAITNKVLEQLFYFAGNNAGLLDWRPNSKKSPGPYGMFTTLLTPAKAGRKGA